MPLTHTHDLDRPRALAPNRPETPGRAAGAHSPGEGDALELIERGCEVCSAPLVLGEGDHASLSASGQAALNRGTAAAALGGDRRGFRWLGEPPAAFNYRPSSVGELLTLHHLPTGGGTARSL